MDQRRWEDLDKDCLMNVFERVGMELLLLDIPFVCKSWHARSLDPSCWQSLIFPDIKRIYYLDVEDWKCYSFLRRFVDENGIDESCFSITAFLKFVVNRSGRHAKTVKLPRSCTVAALKHVADVCPGLKALSLPRDVMLPKESSIVPELIGKWKDLESLSLGIDYELVKLLSQISIHCNKFSHLKITARAGIGNVEVSAIVNFVPMIKHLSLRYAHIPRQCLVELLQGCKELLTLDVSRCTGFNERDDEILTLASHITTFNCEGSSTQINSDSDESYFSGYDDDGYGSDESYYVDYGYGSDESYYDDYGYGSDESYYDDYGYGSDESHYDD